jgi:hypothetical protein
VGCRRMYSCIGGSQSDRREAQNLCDGYCDGSQNRIARPNKRCASDGIRASCTVRDRSHPRDRAPAGARYSALSLRSDGAAVRGDELPDAPISALAVAGGRLSPLVAGEVIDGTPGEEHL